MTPAHRSALEAALEALRSAAFAIEVLISDGLGAGDTRPQGQPTAPAPVPASRRRGGRRPLDLPPKTCAICGATFTRRRSADGRAFAEGAADYRKRQTCGRDECAHAIAMRTRQERNDRVEYPERPCAVCGEPIPRRDRSPTQYAALKSCSRACANQARSNAKKGRPRTAPAKPSRKPVTDLAAPRAQAPTPKAPPKRRVAPLWTPEEDAIIAATYPTRGLAATLEALHDAGYTHRTQTATSTHVNRAGFKRNQSDLEERTLNLVTDYLGLPLTADDVAEELAVPRPRARDALEALAEAGRVQHKINPDRPNHRHNRMYFAPEANA